MTATNLEEFTTNKDNIKFLLLEGIHPTAIKVIQAAGYSQIVSLKGGLSDEELQSRLGDVHFLGIRSRTQLTKPILMQAHKLIAVGCFCIGTNQVDLAKATSLGIAVFNAPFSNTRSVAELVLAEAILLLRGIPARSAMTHRGQWSKSAQNSFEMRGKTLGIVGYGAIGSQLSVLAESLGMKVLFYDIINKLALGNARQVDKLQDLLNHADVVSLHVPESAATLQMMGATQIAAMKSGGILINASRGSVVDIEALCSALQSKSLLGAAIDVFPDEPRSNDELFHSPLQGMDNVILTPHIGGSTVEAQENIGIEVAQKLIKYSDNGTSISSVNFPEVSLPSHPGKHRLLHVHRNVPGVLSKINKIFADQHINIATQFLQTREEIGYVVIDIDTKYSEFAFARLNQIPDTLQSRILF